MAYQDELLEYIQSLNEKAIPLTLHQFVQDNQSFIVQHTTLPECEDVGNIWASRLGAAAQKAKVKLVSTKKKIDWNPVVTAILEKIFPNRTSSSAHTPKQNSSRTPPISSPSKTDSYALDTEAAVSLQMKHKELDIDKKWKLSSGRYVEDVVFAYAEKKSHEHPSHSYIICLDDERFKEEFTEDELNEIMNEGSPGLPDIKNETRSILNDLRNAASSAIATAADDGLEDDEVDALVLDKLIKASHRIGPFDARTEYEQFWTLNTMNQFLGYYAQDVINTMGDNVSELDLVARYWSILDRSFDDIKVVTTRDRTCVATSIRMNHDRSVTGSSEVAKKKTSTRPDLLLIHRDLEYGCSEVGKTNDLVPTKKEVVETELLCPKTMKDILDRAAFTVDFDCDMIKRLRVVCFHETNRRMKVSVMDCPRGYVCRVMQSDEYEIPSSARLISSQLLPMLELTLQTKQIVEKTIRELENYRMNTNVKPGLRCLKPKNSNAIKLPTTMTTTPATKKRRTTVSDTE